jgi:DNA-binding MarR family transcriptional regulator
MIKKLTDKQSLCLGFVLEYFGANDRLPGSRIIAAHFKWSQSNAVNYLAILAKKGYLELVENDGSANFYRFAKEWKRYCEEQQKRGK